MCVFSWSQAFGPLYWICWSHSLPSNSRIHFKAEKRAQIHHSMDVNSVIQDELNFLDHHLRLVLAFAYQVHMKALRIVGGLQCPLVAWPGNPCSSKRFCMEGYASSGFYNDKLCNLHIAAFRSPAKHMFKHMFKHTCISKICLSLYAFRACVFTDFCVSASFFIFSHFGHISDAHLLFGCVFREKRYYRCISYVYQNLGRMSYTFLMYFLLYFGCIFTRICILHIF